MGNIEKFDQMATNYDTPERVDIANISAKAVQSAISDNTNLKTALDFGCGSGIVGLNLIENFEMVYFLDTSVNMLKVVDEKLAKQNIINAKTILLNLEEEKDLDIKVDCIFMCQVLLHIKDHLPVLEKLSKNLNPNGQFIIVDFDKNPNITSDLVHNGFDQKELCENLKAIGFKNATSKNFHFGEKIFMNQDANMFVLKAEL